MPIFNSQAPLAHTNNGSTGFMFGGPQAPHTNNDGTGFFGGSQAPNNDNDGTGFKFGGSQAPNNDNVNPFNAGFFGGSKAPNNNNVNPFKKPGSMFTSSVAHLGQPAPSKDNISSFDTALGAPSQDNGVATSFGGSLLARAHAEAQARSSPSLLSPTIEGGVNGLNSEEKCVDGLNSNEKTQQMSDACDLIRVAKNLLKKKSITRSQGELLRQPLLEILEHIDFAVKYEVEETDSESNSEQCGSKGKDTVMAIEDAGKNTAVQDRCMDLTLNVDINVNCVECAEGEESDVEVV